MGEAMMTEEITYDWEGYFRHWPMVEQRVLRGKVMSTIDQKYADRPYEFLAALAAASMDGNVSNPIALAICCVRDGTVAPNMVKAVKGVLHPPPPKKHISKWQKLSKMKSEREQRQEFAGEMSRCIAIQRERGCSMEEALKIAREGE